jgi:hypothetical protein
MRGALKTVAPPARAGLKRQRFSVNHDPLPGKKKSHEKACIQ